MKYCSPSEIVYGLTSKDLEFSTPTNSLQYYCTDVKNGLNANEYDRIAEETLESLLELIESFEDIENCPEGFDVSYSNGVLSIYLADNGTYVLNKQSPNQQIWLSSPISGPKRYDFIGNKWIYKRDGTSLHNLLQKEMTVILKTDISFMDCAFY
ncbi:frataxin, mitochondrial isoform X2 [Octopus bimaculoides]|uniref:frataxin, mitochondrial isoform X2 n=1 Tax=Octopus bimaculoides TaxID=37653 RepID=UPI0022E7BD4E|nr:frataxin, mitochondrial isoform X2 [Octopus bimaculoides]